MPHDQTTGWRSVSFSDQSYNIAPHNYFDLVDDGVLESLARRFYGVQIENRPYEYLLNRFDRPDTLFFFDPPYVTNTRNNGNMYQFEWSDNDHARAADMLGRCIGYFVVSGYACQLYTDLYESQGWVRRDKEAQTNSGGKRIESIWLSPRTWDALQAGMGLPLFGGSDG